MLGESTDDSVSVLNSDLVMAPMHMESELSPEPHQPSVNDLRDEQEQAVIAGRIASLPAAEPRLAGDNLQELLSKIIGLSGRLCDEVSEASHSAERNLGDLQAEIESDASDVVSAKIRLITTRRTELLAQLQEYFNQKRAGILKSVDKSRHCLRQRSELLAADTVCCGGMTAQESAERMKLTATEVRSVHECIKEELNKLPLANGDTQRELDTHLRVFDELADTLADRLETTFQKLTRNMLKVRQRDLANLELLKTSLEARVNATHKGAADYAALQRLLTKSSVGGKLSESKIALRRLDWILVEEFQEECRELSAATTKVLESKAHAEMEEFKSRQEELSCLKDQLLEQLRNASSSVVGELTDSCSSETKNIRSIAALVRESLEQKHLRLSLLSAPESLVGSLNAASADDYVCEKLNDLACDRFDQFLERLQKRTREVNLGLENALSTLRSDLDGQLNRTHLMSQQRVTRLEKATQSTVYELQALQTNFMDELDEGLTS